ncbi:MAG: polyprenyl synthetase family protein [Candidatus Obscuribacterales bacterium]|nr:polyprenyl synthetase family protein [Steroidobacteraceae bacterium]
MRYAVLGPGKRVRPVLVYATGLALGVRESQLDAAACAIELIHAYSLVHDDLPAMDDDALRRGRPTCHKAFDEATAILAGDALQVLAFQLLAMDPGAPLDAAKRLRLVELLAVASGTGGMAGGQALDLAAEGQRLTLTEVEIIHERKTGALIRAAVMMSVACLEGHDDTIIAGLQRYANAIGLAFQIQDDLLDIEGDPAILGKATGADREHNKPTYPAVAGLAAAKERVRVLHAEALEALVFLGSAASALSEVSDWLLLRRQ